MLVDAIRAEGFRLSKNKTALFWSLLFVPIISLAIGAVTNFVLKGSETKLLGDTKMPPEVREALTELDVAGMTVSEVKGAVTVVDKTWTYVKDDNGALRIVVHHSSLPYAPS